MPEDFVDEIAALRQDVAELLAKSAELAVRADRIEQSDKDTAELMRDMKGRVEDANNRVASISDQVTTFLFPDIRRRLMRLENRTEQLSRRVERLEIERGR